MKILHFIDSLRSGGKERQLVELLKGLSAYNNIICDIATMSRDIHYPEVLNLGIKIHYLIRKKKKDLQIFSKLYKLCRELRPDIIHTWGSFPSVFTVPVAKILGIKFINGTIRKAPVKLKLFSEDWIRSKITFLFSDKIVSNSLAGLESYNAPSQKSICILNGFDFDRIKNLEKPDSIRRRFYITTDKIVGMVATFSRNKDYDTYIKSAQVILQQRDDVIFLAIGDGDNLQKLKNFVQPKYKEKIKFLGRQVNVESIVNTFNVGVLATDNRFHGEGISNTIMEYMALGKPVIATDKEGNRELIIDSVTGFLVRPRDEQAMSGVICRLLDNERLGAEMGRAGRKRIESRFSMERMAQSYVNLYRELLRE
jgi:glycosyltransferase involved in cell wall biosynthesis